MLSPFSHVSLRAHDCRTIAHKGPLSMGFSRQEYWSGLPCPSPGDLPNPGISCIAGRFFTVCTTREVLSDTSRALSFNLSSTPTALNSVPGTVTKCLTSEYLNLDSLDVWRPVTLDCGVCPPLRQPMWPLRTRGQLHPYSTSSDNWERLHTLLNVLWGSKWSPVENFCLP